MLNNLVQKNHPNLSTKRISSQNISHLLLLISIFAIGLLVFRTFFQFSLWGDDWMLMFYTLEHKFAGDPLGIFFSAYGGQAIFMELINKTFGFEPRYYFYASFFLRFVASLSIYFLILKLSKKKIIAFLGAFLFIISFAGIESTNWVHNSVNYLSLAIMNFGFTLIFQEIGSQTFITRKIVAAYILFSAAITLAVVRMHGLLILYPILEILLLFSKSTKIKYALLRSLIVISVFFLLGKLGLFGNVGILASARVNAGLFDFIHQSSENIYKVVLFPFGSFFNSLFPLYVFEKNYLAKTVLFDICFGFPELIFWTIPIIIINFLCYKKVKKGFWIFFVIWFFWLGFLFFIQKGFPQGLGLQGGEVLLGGAVFALFVDLIALAFYTKKTEIWTILTFLLLWPFSFLVAPHVLYTSHTTIESYSRYMTLPSAGSQMLIVFSLFSTFTIAKKKFLVVVLIVLILLIKVFSNIRGDTYFFESSPYRLNTYVSAVWQSLNIASSDISDTGRIRIFVFGYDNKDKYQGVIGFGGWYRYALEHKINNRKHLVVFLGVHELGQVIEVFKDPSYGVRVWGPAIKDNLKLEDVYGFELRGDMVIRNDAFIRDELGKFAL